jgi:Na+/proline symporter
MMLVLLYKAWTAIQHGPVPVRTTPGKAVGFLFIPFFNCYWIFQALWGWTKDYNAVAACRNPQGFRATPGLGLVLCISQFCVPLLFFVILPEPYLNARPVSFMDSYYADIKPSSSLPYGVLFLLLVWFAYLVVQAMFWSEVCDGINALASDPGGTGPRPATDDPAA